MNTADTAPQQSDLHLMRLYYLCFYGANGVIIPFLNLFYAERGLSGSQIGLIAAVGALVTLVFAPIWTRQSEQSNHPKQLLQVSLLLSAIGCLLLGYQTLFWGFASVSLFRALVGAGISPLSDSIALAVTSRAEKGFGSVRLWGSVGWIIVGLFSGWIIEHLGWIALFGVAAAAYVGGGLALAGIQPTAFSGETEKRKRQPLTRQFLQRLFGQPLMIGFGAMLFCTWFFNTGVNQFEGIYLAELGATKSLIGLIGIAGAIVELPVMIWTDRLIRQRGSYWVLLAAMGIYIGLRVLVLLAPSILTILIARFTMGFAYSFYSIGQIVFISEHTTPAERPTILALYTVTLISLIGIIAPPIAGVVYDWVGAHWLYGISAAGYVLAGISLIVARRADHRTLETA